MARWPSVVFGTVRCRIVVAGGMSRAALLMACVSGGAALAGGLVLSRRVASPQGVYIRRIAGTLLGAAALLLALFAWGLERMAA